MNSKSQYWIDTAQYDIDSAKVMLTGKRYLYVGFMCHLAIEKALKAIISNTDENIVPPKIHNLIRLANDGNLIEKFSSEQKEFLGRLNPLNIEARYPIYKDGVYKTLGDSECKTLLSETEELYTWIKQQL